MQNKIIEKKPGKQTPKKSMQPIYHIKKHVVFQISEHVATFRTDDNAKEAYTNLH